MLSAVSETPEVFTVALVVFSVQRKFPGFISNENCAPSSKEECAIPLRDFNLKSLTLLD